MINNELLIGEIFKGNLKLHNNLVNWKSAQDKVT